MIKMVFFDMGGVVVKDTYGYSVIDRILKKYGADQKKYRQKASALHKDITSGKISFNQFISSVKKLTGLKTNVKFKQKLISSSYYQYKLDKKVINIINSLKKKGYRVGMITNTNPLHADAHKKRGQYKYFHPLITSMSARSCKPELKIYRVAVNQAKVKPSECIFIDNLSVNITAAKKFGMKGIVYKNPPQLKKDLERLLRQN